MSEIFWNSFAKRVNGIIKEGKFDASDKVEAIHNGWNFSYDHFSLWSSKHSTRLTRITVPFISKDNFRFEIYEKSLLSSIAKFFGMQDVEIGDSEFDRRFIIKSTNELKAKSLLQNPTVRYSIDRIEKEFTIQIGDQNGIWEEKLPANELELSVYFEGEITDAEILLASRDTLMAILTFLAKDISIEHKPS
jgi:hypothetical protein